MKNTLSVFYPNILDAAKQSGKPVEELLEEAKSCGISALDFDYKQIKNGIPEEVKSSQMKVNSVYAFMDFTQDGALEEAKKFVDFVKTLGAVAMPVPEKPSAEEVAELKNAKTKDEIFAQLQKLPAAVKTAEALDALSRYGKAVGVKVCVENFDSHRSLTERMYELEWLFMKAPDLGFNPDTGNSITCGENITELYEKFSERVVNVHCKDRIFTDGKYKCTAAGMGEMPIIKIRNSLIENGYDGGFSVEVFGVEDTMEAIKISAENLR